MKVAFDKTSITPSNHIGKPLAGYIRSKPCLGKLDDIHVHGVLIEGSLQQEQKNTLLMLSFDFLKLPLSITNYIKRKIISKHPVLDEERIIIHSTHTHASFDLTGEFYYPGSTLNFIKGILFALNRNDRYIVWFVNKTISMVEQLFRKLEPSLIGWDKIKYNPELVINRRHPEQNTNPRLGVIAFRKPDNGQLIGIIINYACHPTTLPFNNYKLSADYPGRTNDRIAEKSGNLIKSIYINGPSGNLNPITTCGTDPEKIKSDSSLVYDQVGTYEDTVRIGYTIADRALELAENIPNSKYFNEIEVLPHTRHIIIPNNDFKYFSNQWFRNKLIYAFQKYFVLNIARFTHTRSNFPPLNMISRQGKIECRTIIQKVILKARNGSKHRNASILTFPGELFDDIGDYFHEHSVTEEENTFIFQNTHDWIGYLFSKKEYVEYGGYELTVSFFHTCGEHVYNEMKDLLNPMDEV